VRKLSLNIEKAAQDRITQVGVSFTFEVADQQRSDKEASVFLIPKCNSYKTLEGEISRLKEELDGLLEEAKDQFAPKSGQQHAVINEELGAAELWKILSGIADTELLVRQFNKLKREKRQEVADYVFTQCNVFVGVASVFSARYNAEEAKLE
jgi:hypothetical protein